jgi:hypothetical protein
MPTMLFPPLLHRRQRPSPRRPRRPSRPRLLLEWLEPRNLPSGNPLLNVNTDTEGFAQNETTLAVNPTNPQNLIGSANDYESGEALPSVHVPLGYVHAHVTFDGGTTWTEYPIPFNHGRYTGTVDPAVAFDADGTAYLATLAYKVLSDGSARAPDLVVAHSADGGMSCSDPVRVFAGSGPYFGPDSTSPDKDYIAAWGHGNAIVTWDNSVVGPDGSGVSDMIFASVTHDGGKTWTAPAPISGLLTFNIGAVPVVAADGSITVAFLTFSQEIAPQFRDHYKVVKVDPATGQPLGAPVEVGLVYDGADDYPVSVDGYPTFQDSEFRSPDSLGNLAADPTDANHLAVIWSDMRDNPYPGGLLPSADPYQVTTNSDIIVSQSFDGGQTWSAPTAIQQPNDQFEPWGAYDAEGRLQIGYYDRSYDPANHKYGYTLASETTPGSLHFTVQQVTTALSDPTQGDAWFTTTANPGFPNATRFLGDYSNIAVTPRGVAALWTDMRLPSTAAGHPGWSEDAFFARIPVSDSEGDSALLAPASPGGAPTGSNEPAALPPPRAGSTHLAQGDGLLPENFLAAATGLALPAPGQAVSPAPAVPTLPAQVVLPFASQGIDPFSEEAGKSDGSWVFAAATRHAREGTGYGWGELLGLAPSGQDPLAAFPPAAE